MDSFEKLKTAALQQNLNGEFPSWLLDQVMVVVRERERYADRHDLVAQLADQIEQFDPYAGAGCFGSAVGAGTIERTLSKIIS